MLKKVLPLCAVVFMTSGVCSAEMIMPPRSIENEVIQVEKSTQAYTMLNQVRKDRNTIYNVLNLTPAQIKKTREIEKERYEEMTPIVDEFMGYKAQLRKLQANNGSKKEMNAIKKEMNRLTKQVKKVCDAYDEDFEKLLNKEQKNKYKMVQKLRFEDMKHLKRARRYSTHKSDLRPFGENISQYAYLEEIKEERSLKTKVKNLFTKDNNLSIE
ncbi:Spy/CpxP family protein refolding chaperone [bacterium]|nr:Spy/CpxP family protein refolding chaperone [bacterium]